jgi:hypothetical protein
LKIKFSGLGSAKMRLGIEIWEFTEMEGMESINHLLYIIVDQNFNISSHVGIPVNGIIGSSVFNLSKLIMKRKVVFL